MNYFKYFPQALYRFGDETNPDVFRNLTIYTEILDEIKDKGSFYINYYIQEFERPDQVSYKLYDTTNYHWTFFVMNDRLRERGWPLTNRELIQKAQDDYSKKTLTTNTKLTDRFKIGQTIQGSTSGATGTIHHRHINLGQLVLSNVSGTFVSGEVVTSTSNDTIESIVVKSFEDEYNSAHHYEDASGNWQDLGLSESGGLQNPGALLTEVTYLDRLITFNDELKSIRVINPAYITTIIQRYREALRS